MNDVLRCEIVRDILPLYIDGLTGDVTAQAVRAHIEACEACKKIFNDMSEPEEKKENETDKEEINFLKKVKKRNKKAVLVSVLGAVLIFCAIIAGWSYVKNYVLATPVFADEVNFQVTFDRDTLIVIEGVLSDSSRGVADVKSEYENGVLEITLSSTKVTNHHKNSFTKIFEKPEPLTQININGAPVWNNGIYISAEVRKLYMQKTEELSALEAKALAETAGVDRGMGERNFGSDQQEKRISVSITTALDKDDITYYESRMRRCACILLACIGDLKEARFDYTVDGEKKEFEITEAQASALYGSSVKEAAATPAGLQLLWESIGGKFFGDVNLYPDFSVDTYYSDGLVLYKNVTEEAMREYVDSLCARGFRCEKLAYQYFLYKEDAMVHIVNKRQSCEVQVYPGRRTVSAAGALTPKQVLSLLNSEDVFFAMEQTPYGMFEQTGAQLFLVPIDNLTYLPEEVRDLPESQGYIVRHVLAASNGAAYISSIGDPVYGDIDGDGITEIIFESFGPTSGLFTFSLVAYAIVDGVPVQKGYTFFGPASYGKISLYHTEEGDVMISCHSDYGEEMKKSKVLMEDGKFVLPDWEVNSFELSVSPEE